MVPHPYLRAFTKQNNREATERQTNEAHATHGTANKSNHAHIRTITTLETLHTTKHKTGKATSWPGAKERGGHLGLKSLKLCLAGRSLRLGGVSLLLNLLDRVAQPVHPLCHGLSVSIADGVSTARLTGKGRTTGSQKKGGKFFMPLRIGGTCFVANRQHIE